jgi:hypothetical protein
MVIKWECKKCKGEFDPHQAFNDEEFDHYCYSCAALLHPQKTWEEIPIEFQAESSGSLKR